MSKIKAAIETFRLNYQNRLGETKLIRINKEEGITTQFQLQSPLLRPGNSPVIFYQGRKTRDVIILSHGLSDSPFYVRAIGKRFYEAGFNVIMPLLPAHGLKEPDKAMEDHSLDHKWRNEMERTVELASSFGYRISLGGYSAGGALCYNYVLRNPENIKGGLFLFSAAIAVRLIKDVSRFIILKNITRMRDGQIWGVGKNPYKYPNFPTFGAMELGDIIRENVRLSTGKKITQPVFAAHSVHDKTVLFQGILDLLDSQCITGMAYLVSQNVSHNELTLDQDVSLDLKQKRGSKIIPKANPQFDMMMDNAIRFFLEQVVDR